MGRIVVVYFVLIISCLSANEAKTHKKVARADKRHYIQRAGKAGNGTKSCVPGKFYQGPGCSKCYCNVNKSMICGSLGTCTLSDKAPTKSELIHIFSRAELYKLPSLPNQGSECTPGESYRVDCNRCLCRQSKSLTCENILCPSYDDVNRLKATEMSGKPCDPQEKDQEGSNDKQKCVDCSCKDGTRACEAIHDCVPHEAEVMTGKLKYRVRGKTCVPGKKYWNQHGRIPCTCSKKGHLMCPGTRHDPKLRKERPFDEAFLDRNSKKKCTPGVVYRRKCNTCRCTRKKLLRCTSMQCLKPEVVQILKKRRQKLENENE